MLETLEPTQPKTHLEEFQEEEPLPQVSFDIRLGKEFEWVDFNYELYKKMVMHIGGSEEDYKNSKIEIRPKKFPYIGWYTPLKSKVNNNKRGTISVLLDPDKEYLTPAQGPNGALGHETKHYIDDKNGKKLSVGAALAGHSSWPAATAGALSGLVGGLAAAGGEINLAEKMFMYGSLPGIVGGIALYGAYVMSNTEKTARASADTAFQYRPIRSKSRE